MVTQKRLGLTAVLALILALSGASVVALHDGSDDYHEFGTPEF